MTKLSAKQLQFLQRQNISLSRVFDASGLQKSHYQEAMRELEMIVAFGVSPCNRAGHTLRTRAGHCAQCNTANLAFVKRFDDLANVYVAYSSRIELTKIGVAKDYLARLASLNDQGYGGACDWRIKFFCEFDRAGRVEFLAQQRLAQYRVLRPFIRSGKRVNCQELFNCKANLAVQAVKKSAREVD